MEQTNIGNDVYREFKTRQLSLNKTVEHTDIAELKLGDYALVISNGIPYQGFVTSIGRKNLRITSVYGKGSSDDLADTAELMKLSFTKDKLKQFYKPQ